MIFIGVLECAGDVPGDVHQVNFAARLDFSPTARSPRTLTGKLRAPRGVWGQKTVACAAPETGSMSVLCRELVRTEQSYGSWPVICTFAIRTFAALYQKIPQFAAAAGMAQLSQRLGLDLADTFPRDVERLSHFFQCVRLPILQTETHLQNLSFAVP